MPSLSHFLGSLLPTCGSPLGGALSAQSTHSWPVVHPSCLFLSVVGSPCLKSEHQAMKTAGSHPGEPPEQLLQEGAPCLTRFLPSLLVQSTRVLSHMAAAFSPSTSSPFHAPSSPVFSLNNTSQSNQINHLLSTSSPGGLFGECGTIFLSLYLLLKPSSGEQQFLSVLHYKQSI